MDSIIGCERSVRIAFIMALNACIFLTNVSKIWWHLTSIVSILFNVSLVSEHIVRRNERSFAERCISFENFFEKYMKMSYRFELYLQSIDRINWFESSAKKVSIWLSIDRNSEHFINIQPLFAFWVKFAANNYKLLVQFISIFEYEVQLKR